MSKRGAKLYFEDIKNSIEKIENYIKGLSFEEFSKDTLVIDAVVRNLTIIGEAARNIPESPPSLICTTIVGQISEAKTGRREK